MKNRVPTSARVMLGIAFASLLFAAASQGLGLGGQFLVGAQDGFLAVSILASAAATLLVAGARTDRLRLVWGALGIAQLLYGLGEISFDVAIGELDYFPTVADILWLAYYPLVLAGVAIYMSEGRSLRPLVWLDGAIAVLMFVAVGFAWVLGDILASAVAGEGFLGGQLAYPLLDLVFIAIAVVLGYACNWRLGPAFIAASAGASLLLVVDLLYFKQLSEVSYVEGTLLDSGWAATMVLMSMAAQLPLYRPSLDRPSTRRFGLMLALVIIPAVALLLRGPDATGGEVAVICAAIALVLIAVRLMITLDENDRLARDKEEIVEMAGEGIYRVDRNGLITDMNPAALRMLDYSPRALVGQSGHELFHHSRANGTPYPVHECPVQRVLRDGSPRRVSGDVYWRGDGTSFPVEYTVSPVREGSQIVGAVVVFDDVTVRRGLEQRLRYEADHDSLSGLLNRRRFIEEVEEQLRSVKRHKRPAAVLMLDLDSFKFVNDSFGHTTGDALIRRVAKLMGDVIRESDVAGRLGGDEFGVLLRETSPDGAERVAAELTSRIKSQTDPSVDASAGIVVFDGSEDLVADDLIARADIALYEAKQAGAGATASWTGAGNSRLAWVDELRAALDEDRLVLYAQPILDLRTSEITSEEILVRMISRDGDVIPPGAFLPTAERFGMIHEIDRRVVAEALKLAAMGRSLSINLSARSIADEEIVSRVRDAISGGLDPSRLTFEITETAAVRNLDEARNFAQQLEMLGCRLALDDFGTGLSSLSHLKHIPAQVLKIDMEFVRGLLGSSFDQYLVKTIVGLAQRLGQRTVAEGVEDASTLNALARFGVDSAQGYYIGKPEPAGVVPPPPGPTPVVQNAAAAVGN